MRSRPLRPSSLTLLLALVALAAMALGAGAASAATPIDLGPSDEAPNLAIDGAGAASLTWTNSEVLQYCRLDPGAGACSASHVFPEVSGFYAEKGNAPLIVGNSVDVLSARYNGSYEDKFLYFSTSGFSSPSTVGTTSGASTAFFPFSKAVFAPAGTVAPTLAVIGTVQGGGNAYGTNFGATNTTGTATGAMKLSTTPDGAVIGAASASLAQYGTTFYGAYANLSDNEIYWRRYIGSGGTPASLNKSANWSTAAPVTTGHDVSLVSGPSGLYLVYQPEIDGSVVAQRFNGVSGFEAPVALADSVVTYGVAEDPAGLLHLTYTANGDDGLHYLYARDASNSAFTNPQDLVDGSFRDLEVATTAAGNGWVTWEDGNTGDALAIPVAPGEPTPAPAPAPPAPPSGAGPGGGNKKVGPEATKTTTKSIAPGLDATLSTPKLCVNGGAAFKAKVAVKRKGSKAKKLSYTVKRVKFSVAGKLITTDTKKPFEAILHAGRHAGASIPVAAKISVKLKKGHRHSSVTKTLTATVTSCG